MRVELPRYTPNPKQWEFDRLQAKFCLFQAGVGSGKTYATVRKFFRNVVECGSDVLHVVGAPSNKIMRKATFAAFIDYMAAIKGRNHWTPVKKVWDTDNHREVLFRNGSRVEFLTLKNPEQFAGPSVGSYWIDEAALVEQSMLAFRTFNERLRDPRAPRLRGFLSTTPRGPLGVVAHFLEQVHAGNPEYAYVTCTTWENSANLPPDYIPTLLTSMSPREIRQQLCAEILRNENAVYAEEFDPVRSLCRPDWKLRGRREARVWVTIDWGPTMPHVLFGESAEDGVDIIFDEMCENQVSHRTLVLDIRERLKNKWGFNWRDLAAVYCDPNPVEGPAELKSLMHGVPVRYAWAQRIIAGIDIVRWRLLDGQGKRWLLFHPRLQTTPSERRILQCMVNYRWTERQTPDGIVLLDTAQKGKWDHGADSLRYAESRLHETKRPVQIR